MKTTVKPRRLFYLISVGIFFFGIFLSIIFAVLLIVNNGEIESHNPGNNLVFNATEGDTVIVAIEEYPYIMYSATEFTNHIDISINEFNITYSFDPDEVEIKMLNSNTTFSLNGFQILFEIEFKVNGPVTLTSSSSNGSYPVNSFGTIESDLSTVSLLFTGIFLSGFGGFVLALISGIVIKVKRNRAKDEIIREARSIINKPKDDFFKNY